MQTSKIPNEETRVVLTILLKIMYYCVNLENGEDLFHYFSQYTNSLKYCYYKCTDDFNFNIFKLTLFTLDAKSNIDTMIIEHLSIELLK